jgi:uncharacterized protein (TIGR00730 family)
MLSFCVFCGSNEGRNPAFASAARELGRAMAERNITLVYGGGNIGLMGILADTVLTAGGRVVGVIPGFLAEREVAHAGLTDMIVVDSMHERKARMAELSDAFIALPGGLGTLEELFEVWTWRQLGLHAKPCGLLNVSGFFDGLTTFLQHAVDERMLKAEHRAIPSVECEPRVLLDRLVRDSEAGRERGFERRKTWT